MDKIKLKGYLNRKELIHISVITLSALISGGVLTYLATLSSNGPKWLVPIGTALPGVATWLYQILKGLDEGDNVVIEKQDPTLKGLVIDENH